MHSTSRSSHTRRAPTRGARGGDRLRDEPLVAPSAPVRALALPHPGALGLRHPRAIDAEYAHPTLEAPQAVADTLPPRWGRTLLGIASRIHYAVAVFLALQGGLIVVLGMVAMVAAEVSEARGSARFRLASIGLALYSAVFCIGFAGWIQAYWGVVGGIWLVVSLGFAAAAWATLRRRAGARWVLGAMLVVVGYELSTTGRLALPAAIAACAAAFVAAGAAARRGLDHVRPWHAALSVAACLLATPVAAFYLRDESPALARIGRQAGVEPLIPFDAPTPAASSLRLAQIYGITPGCSDGILYLTARWGRSGIFEYHPLTGEGRWIGEFGAADNTLLDCATKRLYAGDAHESSVVAFDLSGEWAAPTRRLPLSTPMPLQLALAPERDGLIVSTDRYAIHWLDLAGGEERDVIEGTGKNFAYADGRIYAVRYDVQVFELDAEQGRLRQVARWPLPAIADRASAVVDAARGRLYVAEFENGEILELDLTSGAQLGSTFLARSLRFVRLSPDGRWLLAADFLHGELFVIDPDRMAVVKRVEIGPRTRGVSFSSDSRYAYVASAAGALRIELPHAGA